MTENIIRKLRLENNMTQLQLAELVGVKRTAVAMWEKGDNIPPTEKVKKLSEIFSISTDELIKGFFYREHNTEKIS